MQEAYKNADKISAEVKEKEEEEQKISAKETDTILKFL